VTPALKLKAPAKGLPKAKKTKAPRKAAAAKRPVWSGARKKITVNHLQLTLPGIGGAAL
jgi:hypothetical protein